MANAKVCDRCKKTIIDRPRFLFFRPRLKHITLRRYGIFNFCEEGYDLCKKCEEQLVDFLNGNSVDALMEDSDDS